MTRAYRRVSFVLVCALIALAPYAHARTTQSHMPGVWWKYHTGGRDAPVIFIRAACIGAEDSAAHLRLRIFDHDGTIAYGCEHRGY